MNKVLELTYLPPSQDKNGNPRSLAMQIFRRLTGLILAIIGACIIVVMTIAASYEVRGNGDFMR